MSLALFQRWAAGDDAAFAAIYRQWHPRLVRFAAALTGDAAEGEDIAHDVFVRLSRNRLQLHRDGIQNSRALLYAIVRRLAYNHFAHQQRWGSLAARAEEVRRVLLDAAASSPEELAALAKVGVRIQRAMDELPTRQRELVLLRHREHLSHEEIADVVGCTPSQVKARLNYARRLLRDRLSEMGVVPGALP
ncbi:MAG: RNA polymerase sigma factor [Candidatus Latescibacterota bacterium]